MAFKCTLPYLGRSKEAACFCGPALAKPEALLSIDNYRVYINIHCSARTKIGTILRIECIYITKNGVPLVLERIADIKTNDVLCCQVLLGEKSLGPISSVNDL